MPFDQLFEDYNAARIPDGFEVKSGKHGHHWAQWREEIEKSENDTRAYRLIRLDNGLEALLVSDEDGDRCAATLSVRAGYMHDPPDVPGLAHFCEHLMFCGSQKWPAENELSSFLNKHGGDCNASTSAEYTSFDLTIMEADKFGGALDRLAALFTAPAFEASVVEREIKAINSEFERHKQSDAWRFDHLVSSLSKKGHPWGKFGVGNSNTLSKIPKEKGIDVRKELVKFHKEHYSVNLMRLCLVSTHSLDTLTEMVSGMFSDLPFHNMPPTCWPDHPMGPELVGHQLYVKRVRQGDLLHIEFPLPDQRLYYETAPDNFLSCLIGHESEGSLLAYLKSKDWASSLMAGPTESAAGWSGFGIDIDLTEAGKKVQNDIVLALFSYLKMLKAEGPSERIFQEYAILDATSWRFEEKGDPDCLASDAASNLHAPWPRTRVLSQSHKADKFDADLINETLASLDVSQMFVAYCTPDVPESVELDRIEPIYGTVYGIKKLSQDFQDQCRHPPRIAALHLPHVNPYVPMGIHKIKTEDIQPPWDEDSNPTLLKDEPGLKIWYQQDATFLNPKTSVQLACRSKLACKSARNTVMQRLFTDILEENANELSYQAMEAGLFFGFDTDLRGFLITFSGYTQQLPKLAKQIFEHLAAIQVTPQVMGRLKADLEKSQKNWSKSNAMAKASFLMVRVTQDISFTAEEKLHELQTVTADEVLDYGRRLLKKMFVEAYIHGSMGEDGALHLMEEFTDLIPYEPAENPAPPAAYVLKPRTDSIIHGVAENGEEVNSAIINAYCVGYSHDRQTIMCAALVHSILEEKAFDELRTKQQLGYNVSLLQQTAGRVSALTVRIEGEQPPWQLDEAIEKFLLAHDLELVNMSEEDLEDYKSSLSSNLLEAFTAMSEVVEYNWKGIDDSQLGFKLYKHDAERVGNITKQELIDFYRDYVLPRGHQRAKLSVQVMSKRAQPDLLSDSVEALLQSYPVNIFTELQECIQSKPTKEQLRAALPPFIVKAESEAIDEMYRPFLPRDSSVIIIKPDEYKAYQASLARPPPVCPYEDAD